MGCMLENAPLCGSASCQSESGYVEGEGMLPPELTQELRNALYLISESVATAAGVFDIALNFGLRFSTGFSTSCFPWTFQHVERILRLVTAGREIVRRDHRLQPEPTSWVQISTPAVLAKRVVAWRARGDLHAAHVSEGSDFTTALTQIPSNGSQGQAWRSLGPVTDLNFSNGIHKCESR